MIFVEGHLESISVTADATVKLVDGQAPAEQRISIPIDAGTVFYETAEGKTFVVVNGGFGYTLSEPYDQFKESVDAILKEEF